MPTKKLSQREQALIERARPEERLDAAMNRGQALLDEAYGRKKSGGKLSAVEGGKESFEEWYTQRSTRRFGTGPKRYQEEFARNPSVKPADILSPRKRRYDHEA